MDLFYYLEAYLLWYPRIIQEINLLKVVIQFFFHLWKFEFRFPEACNYYFYYCWTIFDLPVVLFDGHMYEKNFLIKFNDGRQIFSNYRSILLCGFISILLIPSPTVPNLPTCFHTHHQPINIFSVNSTFSFTCKHISCFNHQ